MYYLGSWVESAKTKIYLGSKKRPVKRNETK